MTDAKLKTAILGLGKGAEFLLQGLAETGYFQLEAVADENAGLAEQTAQKYQCRFYSDYRQLITQNQLDCLFVTAPIHTCYEHIRNAIKKKFHILKLPPLARDFEEAAVLVDFAEKQNVRFSVANSYRFVRSYQRLHRFIRNGDIEQAFMITGLCTFAAKSMQSWQKDKKTAGGGILLHDCYPIVDQIIWDCGLPEQVYALNTNRAADRKQRGYSTEETAVMVMKFSDVLTGSLVATRSFEPEEKSLKIHGQNKVSAVVNDCFIDYDIGEKSARREQFDDDGLSATVKLLENFALSILSPDENRLCSSAGENLKNMAVIEAAYLSSRTGSPEEPLRILQLSQNRLAGI